MSNKLENIVKDYLFIAILLGFLVYKVPMGTVSVNEIPPILNIQEYQQKEILIKNSIMQNGVRLLDIKMELQSSVLDKPGDLVAFIKFDSFGNIPTLISLNYKVIDDHGEILYEELGEITVETEASLTKDFKKLNLKKGKYTLSLSTVYNTDVRDEFRQTFEVKGPSVEEIISWAIVVIGLVVIGGSIIMRLIKPRGKKKL